MRKQLLESQRLEEIAREGDAVLAQELIDLQGQIPTTPPPSTSSAISNLIDNSDFPWSDDAYRNPAITPATAGDPNNRAYNWFWSNRATALLVENDAQSLKGPLHSTPDAAGVPRWSKVEGWAEMGETAGTLYDICCPLPNNFVTPGMRFYIQMLVRLRTATALPAAVKFFWEFYDNTNSAPLPDVIKGSAFDLTAATFGPVGATTRDYKLIVDTDYGDQIESNVESVTDAPATLSPTNGVSLSWPRYPGFTQVSIYVTVGGDSFLVGIVGDGAGAFLDTGQVLRPVPSVPSAAGSEPRAYSQTRVFVPTLDWVEYDFAIGVPATYNFGLTTGKQWLRGGILGFMGDANQLQIDRIGVSTGWGLWNISANDRNAASLPSTTQTGSTQGPPAGGGSPPGDNDGGPRCSTVETLIDVCDKDGSNQRKVELGTIEQSNIRQGIYLVGRNGQPNRIKKVKVGWSDSIITIETRNGARRRCSPSDLWLVANGPESGTAARRLCEGVEVLTRIDGSIQTSEIVQYSVSTAGEEVRILSTDGDHVYWAGSAASHNSKLEEGPIS